MTSKKCFVAVVAVYALVFIACAFLTDSRFRYPDERSYYILAKNLVQHRIFSFNGITPTAWRLPGFPLFLATVVAAVDNVRVLRMANLAVWMCAAGLTFKISKLLYGEAAGRAALVLYLLYPVSLYTALILCPQTLASLLLLLSVYLIFRFWHKMEKVVVLLSLTYSYLILTVPVFLVGLAPLIAYLLKKMPNCWKSIIVMLTIITLTVGSWSIRNLMVFHQCVLSTCLGYNIFCGNSDRATADVPGFTSYNGMSEAKEDQFFRAEAWKWMKSHPIRALRLDIDKFVSWFNFRNTLQTSSESFRFNDALMFITYYGLLICSVLFFIIRERKRPSLEELCLVVIYLLVALAYTMVFTRIRFRIPVDSFLVVLSSGFVAEIFKHNRLQAIAPVESQQLQE